MAILWISLLITGDMEEKLSLMIKRFALRGFFQRVVGKKSGTLAEGAKVHPNVDRYDSTAPSV